MKTTPKRKPGPVASDKSRLVSVLPVACMSERAAVEFMEEQRWGKEPFCPHCGTFDVYQMTDRKTGERNARFLWRCRSCGMQYTVRVGTVLEDSRIPVRFWCHAFWRACASKKGVSALQIKRETGLSYKSALFLMHRIRWAMSSTAPKNFGNGGGVVEVDETFIGGYRRGGGPGLGANKSAVLAVVERGGRVASRHIT